jgi:hypothetical protein
MRQLRSSLLVPPGFIVEHAERDRAEVRFDPAPSGRKLACAQAAARPLDGSTATISVSSLTCRGPGIMKDEATVIAALDLTWSNGQTEGQITRLELVKRQMHGRGKIDMLQARMICTT